MYNTCIIKCYYSLKTTIKSRTTCVDHGDFKKNGSTNNLENRNSALSPVRGSS